MMPSAYPGGGREMKWDILMNTMLRSLTFGYSDIAVIAIIVGICFFARRNRVRRKRDKQYSPWEFGVMLLGALFIAFEISRQGPEAAIDRVLTVALVVGLAFELIRSYMRLYWRLQQLGTSQP
jgi:hypothetical protein